MLCAATLASASAFAQSQTAKEGEDLAKSVRDSSSGTILQSGAENNVPGYGGTNIEASKYLDDDTGLTDAGVAARYNDSNYNVVVDPARPEFDPSTIDLSGAKTVEDDPRSYVGDVATGGDTSSCEPLPGTGASTSIYYETCNLGSRIEEQPRSCSIRMEPQVSSVSTYKYYTVPDSAYGTPIARASTLTAHIQSGVCKPTGVKARACSLHSLFGYPTNKFCNNYDATEYECTRDVGEIAYAPVQKTGKSYHEQATTKTVTTQRVDGCGPLSGDGTCKASPEGEVCVEPGETRVIEGVPVTEACWAWKRDFTCTVMVQGNDCGELEAKPQCKFDHNECLSENEDGTCNVYDRVFRCTTEDTSKGSNPAYICSGDLYCINGECTQVEREASTEFKDAMVAVQAMGDVRDQFDPDTLTLFNGERAGCHKPVFGLVNCCAGKTSGLISTASGAAALAGGPTAIAALATPFLTQFLCSSEEKQLDVKDRMGLCHYVGTYCSDKILGVCTSKTKSYCCFESKLSRILQEQGRDQLGKSWGMPKSPDCKGFSPEEFQRLDLSRMDFTEVYSEFVDAAKVPDEIQTSIEIQDRIEEYYKLHGSS